jgi:hypothetical protein
VAERARIDGQALPVADAWENHHRICLALAEHDRGCAPAVLADLEKQFPNHELAWEGWLECAADDANTFEQVRCLDQLLQRFPDNATRQLWRLAATRAVPREERIAGRLQCGSMNRPPCGAANVVPASPPEVIQAIDAERRRLAPIVTVLRCFQWN